MGERFDDVFNPTKCEVIRITKKKNSIKTNYTIHKKELSIVPNGKYLGVSLSGTLMCRPQQRRETTH